MESPSKKSKSSIGTGDELVKSEKILRHLTEAIGSGDESSSIDASEFFNSILELKSIQGTVIKRLYESQSMIETQEKIKEQEEMKLENLKYQKTLHDHSINACNQLETSQLVKLSCDEMDMALPKTDKEREEAVEKWLKADPRNPENRSRIAAKLNEEVNTRTALETELKAAQQKVATLKKKLASKRKLLQALPLKVEEMERASVPLQKFCQNSLNASKKLGSQRQKSLDLAHSLPSPLYTLYYQLQSCLDFMESSSDESSLPVLEISNNSSKIVLKILIPNVSSNASTPFQSTKFACIYFEYDEKWDMITAYSSKDDGMSNLIGELFPGDTGEWTGGEESSGDDSVSKTGKRPYNWCNYLGGLHVVTSNKSASDMHLSTRVVMKALIRRVNSTATLHWLLQTLSRKPNPIPVHQSMTDKIYSGTEQSNLARLANWTEEASPSQDGDKDFQTFVAEMKHNSSTVSIHVRINPQRYPSVPPEIRVSSSPPNVLEMNTKQRNELGHDSPLYNDNFANLERKVNQDIDELVVSTDDSTYNWILAHQLAEVAKGLGNFS